MQEDKHVAEITHLLSQAADRPAGLRWIVRRAKPSRLLPPMQFRRQSKPLPALVYRLTHS